MQKGRFSRKGCCLGCVGFRDSYYLGHPSPMGFPCPGIPAGHRVFPQPALSRQRHIVLCRGPDPSAGTAFFQLRSGVGLVQALARICGAAQRVSKKQTSLESAHARRWPAPCSSADSRRIAPCERSGSVSTTRQPRRRRWEWNCLVSASAHAEAQSLALAKLTAKLNGARRAPAGSPTLELITLSRG